MQHALNQTRVASMFVLLTSGLMACQRAASHVSVAGHLLPESALIISFLFLRSSRECVLRGRPALFVELNELPTLCNIILDNLGTANVSVLHSSPERLVIGGLQLPWSGLVSCKGG